MYKNFTSLMLALVLTTLVKPEPLILLQPFGSTKYPGRTVGNNTERGITLKLSEAIKKELLEEDNPLQTYILNDSHSDKKNNFDILNKINQAQQALVIQLKASNSTQAKPSCSIFFRSYNPLTDQIKRPYAPLTPIPFEEIYLVNFGQSKAFAKTVSEQLKKAAPILDVTQAFGIPLAHLRGIKHPVIQIEISINKDALMSQLGKIIAEGISKSIR